MNVAIASGKGGTGKTTLAAVLGEYAHRKGAAVNVYDCDVEGPNMNFFLKVDVTEKKETTVMIPEIEMELCDGCGKCADICEFSSIVMIKEKPLVLPDMCHSCEGCFLVCPTGAVKRNSKPIGIVEYGKSDSMSYTGGAMHTGEVLSPRLIGEVMKHSSRKSLNIIDSPPGTSCPVVESVRHADYVILVTEASPFGLHDLSLAVSLVEQLKVPFGVVINRVHESFTDIEKFCEEKNIEIIGRIPRSRKLAEAYSKGEVTGYILDTFGEEIDSIAEKSGIGGYRE